MFLKPTNLATVWGLFLSALLTRESEKADQPQIRHIRCPEVEPAPDKDRNGGRSSLRTCWGYSTGHPEFMCLLLKVHRHSVWTWEVWGEPAFLDPSRTARDPIPMCKFPAVRILIRILHSLRQSERVSKDFSGKRHGIWAMAVEGSHNYWLVVWNIWVIFPHIGNFIFPTD